MSRLEEAILRDHPSSVGHTNFCSRDPGAFLLPLFDNSGFQEGWKKKLFLWQAEIKERYGLDGSWNLLPFNFYALSANLNHVIYHLNNFELDIWTILHANIRCYFKSLLCISPARMEMCQCIEGKQGYENDTRSGVHTLSEWTNQLRDCISQSWFQVIWENAPLLLPFQTPLDFGKITWCGHWKDHYEFMEENQNLKHYRNDDEVTTCWSLFSIDMLLNPEMGIQVKSSLEKPRRCPESFCGNHFW